MFPQKQINNKTPLASNFGKWEAEVTSMDYNDLTGHKVWSDADSARDMLDRRSIISAVHEYNDVAYIWHTNKQPDTSTSTTDSEIRAL